MAGNNNLNKLSRKELLRKLKNEFEESETLQWFIEIEILRLTSKKDLTYQSLKELAKFSEKQIKANNDNEFKNE